MPSRSRSGKPQNSQTGMSTSLPYPDIAISTSRCLGTKPNKGIEIRNHTSSEHPEMSMQIQNYHLLKNITQMKFTKLLLITSQKQVMSISTLWLVWCGLVRTGAQSIEESDSRFHCQAHSRYGSIDMDHENGQPPCQKPGIPADLQIFAIAKLAWHFCILLCFVCMHFWVL